MCGVSDGNSSRGWLGPCFSNFAKKKARFLKTATLHIGGT